MTIAGTLNIAKEGLLTHMSAITVAGHNIANVNTPGYSRQVLNLTTPVATPTGIGYLGNGVRSDSVLRQYDAFMTQRLMSQNATINNLTTQQQSMRVIETAFNEVPGLAVNELLGKFWESWQALSNNPELSSNRQTVVQQAQLLTDQLRSMTGELTQTKFDTGVSMKSAINDVNALAKQIADLNTKITASETDKQQQNDLRDTRDNLLKDLGGYVDINYFENGTGAYTVMMSDGHSLVSNGEAWSLDWANNKLEWINTQSNGELSRTSLNSNVSLGGTVGGLQEINNQLVEGNPDNYLGRLNALSNSLIREVNQQHSQGVGLVSFSDELTSAELAHETILLQTTVDTRTATSTLAAGSLSINGRSIGRIDGASTKDTSGLAMGKTANAAAAINSAAAGVSARMTTLVAGGEVTAMNAAEDGETLNFTINGVAVSYPVDSTSLPDTGNDTNQASLAKHIIDTINTAITNHNNNLGLPSPQANIPKVTIKAVLGNGANGGAVNAIILQNSNPGDESAIRLSDLSSQKTTGEATTTISNLNLTAGSFQADASHNTGELSVFAHEGPIVIDGGANDSTMSQLGWAGTVSYSSQAAKADATGSTAVAFTVNGKDIHVLTKSGASSAKEVAEAAVTQINLVSHTTGVTAEVGDGTNGGVLNSIVFSSQTSNIAITNLDYGSAGAELLGFSTFTKIGVAAADDSAGDGKLTYTSADHSVGASLMGLDYADTLTTDGKSFAITLYNRDGSLALAQPVTIDLTRAYNLQDVANTINSSIKNATNNTTPWVAASVVNNQLVFKPDANHSFAFGHDSSNFLAAMGINTFFSGHSADTIEVNGTVSANLDYLAAGKINEFGEIFRGDNANALAITNIQRDENVTYLGQGSKTDTLDGYYNSLIAEIGLKGKSINSDLDYNKLVSDQLNEIRDATSGVSLDEEMANLIKFQHAYSAAAKLISTSDEMLQTLLATIR